MKILTFSRYREFTIGPVSCWYDRKDKRYGTIIDGQLIEQRSMKALEKDVATALRMDI